MNASRNEPLSGPPAPQLPSTDACGQRYWRSVEEFARRFPDAGLQGEFGEGASEWEDGVSRRNFLKLAAASLALAGLNGCTRQPPHEILPYVRQPEELVPGEPLYYATAMTLGGYATGALVKAREGRPIKVDGNPSHPASRGGSSVWLQASILDLYDPDRSKAILANGDFSSWPAFVSEMNEVVRIHKADRGAGLRFLTETVTSPTLEAQLADWLRDFPEARAHRFEPLPRDFVRQGARLAFGEVAEAHYRFDQAAVIVSLESDFLYTHPERLRYTREFTDGRRVSAGAKQMNRLYMLESTPSVTGSMADHRLPIASGRIAALALFLAGQLGAMPAGGGETLSSSERQFVLKLLDDLQRARGKSIVIAGEYQPPVVHALAHLLNDYLGNHGSTVYFTAPADAGPLSQVESLKELSEAMRAGTVQTLFILGGNPVYTAPADFAFAEGLQNVKRSIHTGLEFDETAARCTWHIPQAHYLESWGDARAFDGTTSLIQPLIAPLYGGKTFHEILAAPGRPGSTAADYEIVKAHWANRGAWPDFEKGWRKALHEGWIADSALPEKPVSLKTDAIVAAARGAGGDGLDENSMELTFRPDPSVWDGRFANNGWLQECARPISKLTWDNAVLISPRLAQRRGLKTNDVVEITFQGRRVRGPIWLMPGQAENTVTLWLGSGRERVGRVGTGVGFNAYRLRTSDALWRGAGAALSGPYGRRELVSTQAHRQLESPERQVYRKGTWQQFQIDPDFLKQTIEVPHRDETLYEPQEHPYPGHRWAMSIDLTTCIGCNSCLVACNAENNIPVVGKDQVKRGREMYWIRIDTYFEGPIDNPQFNHQPVPCMHCEHAPCELVCPVEATVHDREGLNLQVYNRCVGTRFCSNNCPYKVRRFNFFQYADYRTPGLQPLYNPDVTVRWRGVMEKCTYCVQRIAAGRIAAEKQNRAIREGEVRTACQEACPANAIVFGDLNATDSVVTRLKRHPLDYPMLGQLNTRPRTTYLARLQNPNPDLPHPQSV